MMPRDDSQFTTKQEIITSDGVKIPKATTGSTTTSWSRLKDPRIVRVSRAFGGKDRHSKVCTVRGLRDRRVRLSVPTAIQLYDLQDRLGLNQPSKVVDWLLNAAKHEIDELPPLQIPQGSLMSQSLQPYLDAQSAKQGLKIGDTINWSNDPLKLQARTSDPWGKPKDLFSGETSDHREENWARSQQEFQENQGAYNFSSNNFLSRQNHSNSIPNLLNSSNVPYNSFLRWDPSNLTLSHHPPRSHGLMVQHQDQDSPNFSLVPLQPTASSGSHPVLVYQPGISTQSYFPSQIAPADSDYTQKQMHFHTSSNSPHADSTTQSVRPFHFSMTADLLPRNDEKDDEFRN